MNEKSLHKRRLIKLFARAQWSQSHTRNGFWNLWKHCYRFAHASFHTVQNCRRLTAISTQQCHYLAVLPAKMSVFNSHICDYAGLPFSDFK